MQEGCKKYFLFLKFQIITCDLKKLNLYEISQREKISIARFARYSHHRRMYCCLRRRRDSAPCITIERPRGQTARRSTADASKRRTRSRPDDKPFPWPFSPNPRRPRCVCISRTLRRKLYKHEKRDSHSVSSGKRINCGGISSASVSAYRDVSIFISTYVRQPI